MTSTESVQSIRVAGFFSRCKKGLSILAILSIMTAAADRALAQDANSNSGGSGTASDRTGSDAGESVRAIYARLGEELQKLKLSAKATGSASSDATTDNGMPLDDIQDVAFTLQRIRQQSINIYVESTRKKVTHYSLDIPSLTAMPKAALEDQSVYLPLRKGWLVFFIGTMEPLVQILNAELKKLDEKAEQKDVPADKLPEWQGILKDWKEALHGLNDQLNSCACLLDDSSVGNVEVAKSALAIDHQVSIMDDILHRSSKFLQEIDPVNK